MQDNYFVLKEFSSYLNNVLKGARIIECFSQEKNKLVIRFIKDERDLFLEYSSNNDFPYLVLRNKYTKARKNVAEIFKKLNGLIVSGAGLINDDRLVCLSFNNYHSLIFSFIKSKLNALITYEEKIIETFKDNKSFTDKNINEIFLAKDTSGKQVMTVRDYIRQKFSIFGKLIQNEVLNNLGINNNDKITELLKSGIDNEFIKIKNELDIPEYIIYNQNEQRYLSLVILKSLDTTAGKEIFENINELLSSYIFNRIRSGDITGIKNSKLKNIGSEIVNLEKKINNLEIHQQDAFNSYKNNLDIGNLILANLDKIKKGDNEFKASIDGQTETVKLDFSLAPSENAQKYFSKYKKQKSSLDLLGNKIDRLKLKLAALKKEEKEIMNLEDAKEIRKLDKSLKKMSNETETSRFRKFVLSKDFEVWVGRDSKSNDLLTMKYSSQNDLWFHIRGTSGSHTVLKTGNKNELLDKKTIETAASICAYYSKARNAGTVPVAYCLRKYVKKMKGFNEGSVIMEKEKVIFVKPKLPDNEPGIK